MPLTVNNRDFVLVVTGLGNKKQLWLSEIRGGGRFVFICLFLKREREKGEGKRERLNSLLDRLYSLLISLGPQKIWGSQWDRPGHTAFDFNCFRCQFSGV